MFQKMPNIKFLVVGFFIAKIIVTLVFLSCSVNVFELVFNGSTAIAEEENKPEETKGAGESQGNANPDTVKSEDDQKADEEQTEEIRGELEGMEEKRQWIINEQKRLDEKKVQLENLKQEIEEKVSELTKVRKELELTVAKMEEKITEKQQKRIDQDKAKIKQLVKVYTSMKPKTAAELINKMDMDVILELFSRMKGEQIGRILSYVERNRAAKISEKLAPEKRAEIKSP